MRTNDFFKCFNCSARWWIAFGTSWRSIIPYIVQKSQLQPALPHAWKATYTLEVWSITITLVGIDLQCRCSTRTYRCVMLNRCQGIENCKLALSQAYSTISVRWVASLVLWVPLAQRLSLSSNTGEPACLSWVQWSLQIRNLIKRPLQTIQRSIISSGAAPRLAILTARLGARVDSSRSSALVWEWTKETECSTRTTWCS